MALTRAELALFKERLENASRPLVFYDDDADGLSSFLLCQKANPDARGARAARGPELVEEFVRKVEEHQPDVVFVLDKPKVALAFVRAVKQPIIWLDHHQTDQFDQRVRRAKHVTYLNPRLHNERDARSVSYWVWRALGGPLWIATVGTVGDWYTILLDDFREQHPLMAPKKNTIAEALYDSPLGELVHVVNFLLKGKSSQINKSVNALARVESPEEILNKATPRGKYLAKQAARIKQAYEEQRDEALATKAHDGLYLHVYENLQYSMIGDVANEMLVRKPRAEVICLARKTTDGVKFSMRSQRKDLPSLLDKALKGLDGYGGGHKNAVGGSVADKDWEEFCERLRQGV